MNATMRRAGQNPRGLDRRPCIPCRKLSAAWTKPIAALRRISFRVPLSRAYGVATFYHFFTLKPAGEHTCAICLGTACYIKGRRNWSKR